jgi:Ala-tRNA(Pro) deacylase
MIQVSGWRGWRVQGSGENQSMKGIAVRLESLLEAQEVDYETVYHPKDYTAMKAAADTHTPPEEFAKSVILKVDGKLVMAVLPASETVALKRVREALGAGEVEVAHEEELKGVCPDSQLGAWPPFGSLYELPVYVSTSLAEDEEITFNAGSHDHAIRVRYADYARLESPAVIPLCRHDSEVPRR